MDNEEITETITEQDCEVSHYDIAELLTDEERCKVHLQVCFEDFKTGL